jgi:hypothetical protein
MSTWVTAWVLLVCGIALVLRGAVILTTGKAMYGRERRRMRRRPLGQGLILLGMCPLIESIPALAGGSPLLIVIFNGVAFVPLIGATVLLGSARLPRTS